jgi:uncharacterized protein (TIGR01244 family)
MTRAPLPILLLALLTTACSRAADSSVEASEHVAVTTEKLEPYACGEIARLHTLGGVFLASQPAADDLRQAEKGGVRTVINLRRADERVGFDEGKLVKSLGLEYVHYPFNGADEMTDDVIDHLRELLDTVERPILLHCGSANRVGAVWLPYRVLDGGLTYEAALTEAKTVGLMSPAYEERARDYIASRKSE